MAPTIITAYDENGNIKRMQQWGMKIAKAQIDNLGYEYENIWTNKLINVSDSYSDPNTKLGDFKDGTNDGGAGSETPITDYQYDVNGNMIVDWNKNIYGPGFVTGPGIVYNQVMFQSWCYHFKTLVGIEFLIFGIH